MPDKRQLGAMTRVEVSIIIPAYNAAFCLHAALSKLHGYVTANTDALGPVELIVVDDGSTDRTAEIVERGFPSVILIRHDRNRGKGAAVRTGMLAARGRFRFFTDADMPFDLAALTNMLKYLRDKGLDICIGARNREQLKPLTKRTMLRRLTSRVFTAFVSRVVVTGIRDTQCGLKGFRAEVAEYLFRASRVSDFAFDVEILYLAFRSDLDVKRVPVRLVSEDFSSVSILRHAAPMMGNVLLMLLRYNLGYYPMMPERSSDEV
jgi:dolichyl-phosphate beta-glucosyltransferase